MSITDELRKFAWKECPSKFLERVIGIADDIDAALADHIPLPKDADGKTIHLQDRMMWDNGTFNVHELNLTAAGWTTWDELHGYTVRADQCRHYHEQTVEDVLRNVVTLCRNTWKEESAFYFYDVDDVMESGNIAEYAAKLRLAGEDA